MKIEWHVLVNFSFRHLRWNGTSVIHKSATRNVSTTLRQSAKEFTGYCQPPCRSRHSQALDGISADALPVVLLPCRTIRQPFSSGVRIRSVCFTKKAIAQPLCGSRESRRPLGLCRGPSAAPEDPRGFHPESDIRRTPRLSEAPGHDGNRRYCSFSSTP